MYHEFQCQPSPVYQLVFNLLNRINVMHFINTFPSPQIFDLFNLLSQQHVSDGLGVGVGKSDQNF